MLLFLLSQAYFLLFLEPWDKRKVSQRNLYCMLEIRVLKNLSPNCMRVILKEHDTVNSTANLSINMKTFDQSENDTEIWYHGTAASKTVSRLRLPFPLPRIPLGSVCLPIFFLFDPFFYLFPPLRNLVPGCS